MAVPSKPNVELGEGDFFVVAPGTTAPEAFQEDEIFDEYLVVGNNVGYSKACSIQYGLETTDIEAAQSFSPILKPMTKETASVKITMMEHTLENLKLAWGIEDDVEDSVTIGSGMTASRVSVGGDRELVDRIMGYKIRKRDNSGWWIYIFHAASIQEVSEISFQKDAERSFEVTFFLAPLIGAERPDYEGKLVSAFVTDTLT